MSGLKWIKISTDMFDDEKIRLIEQMPEGDSILVIWIKFLALAGRKNAGGEIFVNNEMPYTDEMLATIFHRKVATVRLALKIFQKFGMIEIANDQTIVVSNWGKHQNLEGIDKIRKQNLERKRKSREDQRRQALAARELLAFTTTSVARDENTKNAVKEPDSKASGHGIERDGHVTQRDTVTPDSVTDPPLEEEEENKSTEPSSVSQMETNGHDFNIAKKWLNGLFDRQRAWSYEEDQRLSELLPIDTSERALLSWAYSQPRDAEGWALVNGVRANKPKSNLIGLLREFSSEIDKWRGVKGRGRLGAKKNNGADLLPPAWIEAAKKLYGADVPLPSLKSQLPLSVRAAIEAAVGNGSPAGA
jgi:predicted phage replisome organizer